MSVSTPGPLALDGATNAALEKALRRVQMHLANLLKAEEGTVAQAGRARWRWAETVPVKSATESSRTMSWSNTKRRASTAHGKQPHCTAY